MLLMNKIIFQDMKNLDPQGKQDSQEQEKDS